MVKFHSLPFINNLEVSRSKLYDPTFTSKNEFDKGLTIVNYARDSLQSIELIDLKMKYKFYEKLNSKYQRAIGTL